jgi:hypothetical protein
MGYTESNVNIWMNTLLAIVDGDDKEFTKNYDDEVIIEIKFSDSPVVVNMDGNASNVEFVVGQEFEVNGIKYRVMDTAGNLSAISLTASAKKVIIPDSVEYSGCTLKVTDVAQNFMKGNKKVQNVTIGANVTTIGKCAFYNCKKLKKVTVKSEKITAFGQKAFGKNARKFTLKVPKSSKKNYKKLLKKARLKTIKLK